MRRRRHPVVEAAVGCQVRRRVEQVLSHGPGAPALGRVPALDALPERRRVVGLVLEVPLRAHLARVLRRGDCEPGGADEGLQAALAADGVDVVEKRVRERSLLRCSRAVETRRRAAAGSQDEERENDGCDAHER